MVIASDLDYAALIERLGLPVVLLVFILFTGFKRYWVWGYQLRDSERRERDWKDMALRGTLIAEKATGREKWTVSERLEHLERLVEDQ